MIARRARFLFVGFLVAGAASQTAPLPKHPPLPVGQLTAGRDMTAARAGHTATTLPDFTVLVAGGRQEHGVILASTEVYDPNTEKFTKAGKMSVPRAGHIAAVLEDAKIIIAGGITQGGAVLASSEDYDFETGKFTVRGNMHARRVHMTATTLRDGRILVTGGDDGTQPLDSAETYDVLTGKWTPVGKMTAARAHHTATRLSDGRVLIVGGTGAQHAVLASAEIFDPKTNQFTAVASLHQARYGHTAALLSTGKVFIAGGASGPGSKQILPTQVLASAEIYDPQHGTFTSAGNLTEPRFQPESSTLLDGRVLIVGGAASVEIYDPRAGTFGATAGSLDAARSNLAIIQLMDGSARVFGGADARSTSTAKTWAYRP
jgi:hypothetical protein